MFQCLKTSRCCARLTFPYIFVQTTSERLLSFLHHTRILWRNIQSYQMQASPPSFLLEAMWNEFQVSPWKGRKVHTSPSELLQNFI